MVRHALVVSLFFVVTLAFADTRSSDTQAQTLARQSVAALTRGDQIGDVTLSANVTSVNGSDQDKGSATLLAKGTGESRVDLIMGGWNMSDVRNVSSGMPTGAWAKNGETANAYAIHNCWTDAVWFFPALSSLTQTENPNFVFKYVGLERHSGASVQHIRVFSIYPADTKDRLQSARLSTIDFYLDATSLLPVATGFVTHPDSDMNTDMRVEVRFANYQLVSGVQVPFHVQRLLNGTLIYDLQMTNATLNSGLADPEFTLQ